MKGKIITTLLMLMLLTEVSAQTSNKYEVELNIDRRLLFVEAELERNGDFLTMDWEAAEFLEDGWSTFVQNIQAETTLGEPIELTYEQPGKWKMNDFGNDVKSIRFSYEVVLGHDKIEWEAGGHDEAAYVLDDIVFMIGRVLFITAGQRPEIPDHNTYQISFTNLPEHYKISSIWKPLNENSTEWLANGTHELIGSLIHVGNLLVMDISNQGINVQLSGAHGYQSGLETFAEVFEPLLEISVEKLYPLEESTFVLSANVAPATMDPYFSGGLLHRSISIISPFIPDQSMMPMMQYILYHEYLHIYGVAMNLDPIETYTEYWFSEGVHDYMSSLMLLSSGRINAELFLNSEHGLSGNILRYDQAKKLNIRAAGHKKFENYDLIYSGGHVLGALMDIIFIHNSEGNYDLINYINEILALGDEKRKTGQHVHYEDLKNLATTNGGEKMEELFQEYVEGSEVFDIQKYFYLVGLDLNFDDSDAEILIMEEESALRKYYLERFN